MSTCYSCTDEATTPQAETIKPNQNTLILLIMQKIFNGLYVDHELQVDIIKNVDLKNWQVYNYTTKEIIFEASTLKECKQYVINEKMLLGID